MKKLMVWISLIILLMPLVMAATDSVSDFDSDFTRKEEVTISVRDERGDWSNLTIKYGLIGEAGVLVYSDDPMFERKNFDYYYEFETINSGGGLVAAEREVRLKFSVGTHMRPINNEGWLGFFYEFIPSNSDVVSIQPNTLQYYPKHQMFVNPNRYHIYLSDLIEMYGKDKVEVIGNRVFIYVLDNGEYYNFDPPIGGDGIPLECVMSLSASYNQTNVTTGDDFKMGGKAQWSGSCSNLVMGWQDNTTGSWANIPTLALDLSCNGATCTQSNPSNNVWYYKYPKCEADGQYGVRVRLSYTDHDGNGQVQTTSKQEINCGDYTESPYRAVDLLFPANNTEYDVGTEVTFQSNFTTTYTTGEGVYNFSLWHDVGGTWSLNQSVHFHIPILTGKNLMTVYFNNTNDSMEGTSPLGATNDSIDLVSTGCFFGDMTCANCSSTSGRYVYTSTNTLNISEGTICWWMKTLSAYSSSSKWIIFNYPNTNENLYYAWFGSSQQWGFKKEHLNNNYVLYYNPPSNPAINDFFHTCISWDNSYTGIYINGEKEASSTGKGAPTQKQTYTEFFGRGNPSSNCDCVVDELVVFDRRLTDDEIESVYLPKNYTVNWSNQGQISAGTYEWNSKAVFGTPAGLPLFETGSEWNEHNWTFTILGAEITLPTFMLDSEDIRFTDYIYLAIGFLLVMGIIIVIYVVLKNKTGG